MLGLINDCAEQLVITKFGIEAWHAIKKAAGCEVKDHGFEQHGHYPDSATVDIVVAAAKALSVTVDDVLELFGEFFLQYTIDKGYDNLLRCQGSTLRLWLSNLNALHDHLQSSLPAGNFPVFWCENCEVFDGAIILHYYSVRGALLGGVVVGIVKEVAKTYFDVEVQMDKLAVQGENGSECTTWRITAKDPTKRHKLTMETISDDGSFVTATISRRRARRGTLKHGNRSNSQESTTSSLSATLPSVGCPFSSGLLGANYSICPFQHEQKLDDQQLDQLGSFRRRSSADGENQSNNDDIRNGSFSSKHSPNPIGRSISVGQLQEVSIQKEMEKSHPNTNGALTTSSGKKSHNVSSLEYENGLPSVKVRSVFPYHVMVDKDFTIVQVGKALPDMLLRDYDDLVGLHVGAVLKISKPILAGFDWPILQRLADQKFFLSPVPFDDEKTGARIEAHDVKFKGNLIKTSNGGAMFVLSPDADNITELTRMGLTMSDLPLHSFQRDVVFLGEHIASEVRTAHKLDRLSKKLDREKTLSNTLLESMLPGTVAEKLRRGETVEPLLYENVTLFFSDVVGFTSICDAVEPWDVIDMLNKLYTVMDHLASEFNLYKVETIGDAYMCCSGMPTPDENHAQNIANFALAVADCVHLVKSPADGKPLQLRIGIHTGHCMGGVVGTLTPHYCLFGDMVNTTSRHESTGAAGKIQCSKDLYEHLAEFPAESQGPLYKFTPRGYVEMKGKSRCYTYWLESATKFNKDASRERISEIKMEVKSLLSKKKWMKRRYFHITRRASGGIIDDADAFSLAPTTVSAAFDHSNSLDDCGSTVISSIPDYTQDFFDDCNSSPSDHDTVSYSALKKTQWFGIKWDPNRSRVDMVATTHGLISSMLWKCVADVESELPENKDDLDHELLRYIDKISSLYEAHPFHSWEHACQVVLSASFLVKEYHKTKDEIGSKTGIDSNPFVRFITVFSALIHDVGHLGMPNAQLVDDKHCLTKVYRNSFLERQSLQIGLGIFIEDFPDLSTMVLRMCPEFVHLVTSAVLATDVSSQERQKEIKDRFERVTTTPDGNVSEFEKTQAVVEQILLLADVGHCTQGYDIFLDWNAFFFMECLTNFKAGHGPDPRAGWFKGQISFIEFYIIPLAERCSALVPSCEAVNGARTIVNTWKLQGEEFTKDIIDRSGREEQQEQAHHMAKYTEKNDRVKSTTDGSGKDNTKSKSKKNRLWRRLASFHRRKKNTTHRNSTASISSDTQ